MNLDRVVFDSNIYLSAILSRKIYWLADFIIEYNIVVYTCSELLNEIEHNLNQAKFNKYLAVNPKEYIDFIKEITLKIDIDKRFDRAADVKDNFLFDLAFSAQSFFIVTGEKNLQAMKHVGRIQVLSPHLYFKIFNKRF